MPTIPLAKKLSDETCRKMQEASRQHENRQQAADALGMDRATYSRWLDEANRRFPPVTVEQIAAAYSPAAPDISPRETPKYRVIAPEGKFLRVLAIGDSHDHPGIPDKSRFALMGRYAAEERPDVILHIGDFLDLHSLCSHTREDTYKGKGKPSFEQDIASAAEAMAAFEAELPADYRPRKHITFGNHEHRAWRYEDINPASVNLLTGPLTNVFESHDWTWQSFGHWTMIAGVGFTHIPRNIMGRPVGGKNIGNSIANEATFDIAHGHDHRANVTKRAKYGYNNFVTIVGLGTSMVPGYVADYAEGLPTGYDYGVNDLTIYEGHIQSATFRTFRELEYRLGRRAA